MSFVTALGTGAVEQSGEAGDLDIVEAGLLAVAAIDRHLREPRQHVVARMLPLLDRELVEVRAQPDDRALPFGGRVELAGLAVEARVEQEPDLLAVGLGRRASAMISIGKRREVGDRRSRRAPERRDEPEMTSRIICSSAATALA
jgi:hypothetical protein